MFDPHPSPEVEAAAKKKFELKQHEHEEHERAKAEKRKSHDAARPEHHKSDLSGGVSSEATKHKEEKARKRKSIEGRHHAWGLDIPKFWKRHEKCEEEKDCVVPHKDKEHENEECPHA